jgi:type II secretory pathway component GspD/PulD (secretin)
LEVQIISLSESGSKTFDNTWQYLSKNFSFNAGGGKGFATNPNHPVFFSGKGYESYDYESYQGHGEWDVKNGVYRWNQSQHLVYAMNYLIENQKGRVLANPRILLTSGQTSTIDLTADYVAKVTSQYLDSASASGSAQVQKEYEVKDDNGIKVTITPFISPDGYVTLDIKPEYKTIASQLYTAGEADERELAVTLLQRRDLDLKGVRIKDGETLVIGGMIQEMETKTVSKIPFLGDLPVIGMFFRSTGTNKEKSEMVIMLTPQIVLDTEDAIADDNML